MEKPNPSSTRHVLSFLQRLSRRVLMEDYIRRNIDIPPAPKDTKSIFSKDNATLCSSLGEVLGLSLNIEILATAVYEPGFGIVPTKPLHQIVEEGSSVKNDGYRSNLKGKAQKHSSEHTTL
ncbi:putative phospholipase A1 member A isoform X2 [Sesbania bispinosa]|nr:putative phospholipase A1 member A isoform X2 [Sesbania bispinosa]